MAAFWQGMHKGHSIINVIILLCHLSCEHSEFSIIPTQREKQVFLIKFSSMPKDNTNLHQKTGEQGWCTVCSVHDASTYRKGLHKFWNKRHRLLPTKMLCLKYGPVKANQAHKSLEQRTKTLYISEAAQKVLHMYCMRVKC